MKNLIFCVVDKQSQKKGSRYNVIFRTESIERLNKYASAKGLI